jgi:hypothetical protein
MHPNRELYTSNKYNFKTNGIKTTKHLLFAVVHGICVFAGYLLMKETLLTLKLELRKSLRNKPGVNA